MVGKNYGIWKGWVHMGRSIKRAYNYGIPIACYFELKYFCLQYDSMKQQLEGLDGIKGVSYGELNGSGGTGDPTATVALQTIRLKKDIEAIESTAEEVGEGVQRELLYAVTQDLPYERTNAPCGRRQFYEKRRAFFNKLYEKRKRVI